MDRLFLDANILFSAAYRPDAGVRRLWKLRDAQLLTSDYAVEEARRNLGDPEQIARLDSLLDAVVVSASVSLDLDMRAGVDLREKDWPILGGAVAAHATHLITGDLRDFGAYFGKQVLAVTILPPADYLKNRG